MNLLYLLYFYYVTPATFLLFLCFEPPLLAVYRVVGELCTTVQNSNKYAINLQSNIIETTSVHIIRKN
jgi:hypothetical protein